MLLRSPTGFTSRCLPSSADRLPSGPDWVHEIKHDGYRLMARRDPVGIPGADPERPRLVAVGEGPNTDKPAAVA
jgi:hypothetical protein